MFVLHLMGSGPSVELCRLYFICARGRVQSPVATTTMRKLWQQAEAVDLAVAKRYDSLGMAEYEAIETFSCFFMKKCFFVVDYV